MNLIGIEIYNFKTIKELKMDFRINKAYSDSNVKLGIYKRILKEKNVLPYATVLMGRNAIGKTSILNAISLVDFLLNKDHNEFEEKVRWYLEFFIEKEEFIIKDNELRTSNKKERISQIDEDIKNKNGKTYELYKSIKDKLTTKLYKKYKRVDGDDIHFTLKFDDDGEEVILEITLSSKGNVLSVININNKEIKISKYLKNIIYGNNIRVHDNFDDIFRGRNFLGSRTNDLFNFHFRTNDLFNFHFEVLFEVLGVQKTEKLLKLADPNITKVTSVKDKFSNKRRISQIFINGSPQSRDVLSSGTVKFIKMNWLFCKAIKNKSSLVLIDEIELNLHKELINALKAIMISLYSKYNIQFIFTTHSPIAIEDYLTYAQVLSIDIDESDIHKVTKISSIMNPNDSAYNNYKKGFFAPYHDKELLRNSLVEIY